MIRHILTAGVVALLVAGAASASTASESGFVRACVQQTGSRDSIGDLNVRLKTACAGRQPLELATLPLPQAAPGPKGEPGARGPRGKRGPAGITETRIVTRASSTNVSSPKTVRARCPAGTVITGGGYSSSVLSTDLILRMSAPVRNSWEVNAAEAAGFPNGIAWFLSAHAICATT